MDYEKKYKIGDYVTAKEKPTNVKVEGEFCGYALADKSDPTSVVGHVLVKNDPRIHGKDNLYSVGIESIKLAESEDERIRKEIVGFIDKVLKDKNVLLLIADRIGDDIPNMIPGWIAYLEKQKEQKPNIEHIQRSWYMKGYSDGKFGREPKWIIKTGDGGPRYEDNPRYGQPLATKDKKESLRDFIDDFPYSDKQKEHESINECNTHEPTLDEARKWNEAYEKGYSLGYENGKNEQKPVDDKAFEEWIDDWWKHNKVNNPDSYDKGDEIQFDEQGFKNFCRGIRNMYQPKQECSEDFTENIRTLLNNKLTHHSEDGSISSTVFIDDKTLKDIVSGIWFYVGKEALKYPKKEFNTVEWSEEDEAFLKVAIAICNKYSHKDIADWLKSLRPKPQGTYKWSEEDKRKLNRIYEILAQAAERIISDKEAVGLQDFLASLRPQQKKELSIEKAIQWLDDTFYFLDNSSGRGRDCEITTHDFDSLEEMYDSFRKAVIVDSEPHWKPSEEQMKALLSVLRVEKGSGDKIQDNLESLYIDLRKLI